MNNQLLEFNSILSLWYERLYKYYNCVKRNEVINIYNRLFVLYIQLNA